MGQSQTGEPDDSSCFRACIRDKKSNTLKQPAAPFTPDVQYNLDPPVFLQPPKTPERKAREPPSSSKNMTQTRGGQTSLQQRLQQSVGVAGKATTSRQKRAGQQLQDQEGVMLGLESKFSSTRKTILTKNRSPTKITASSEGLGTRSNWQKQNGESDETSSKSHGASTDSTKSRKVLLNKIEHLKQRYYERELEIQIYQNENQYQEQLEGQHQRKREEPEEQGSGSRGREESVKGKILQKLKQRKMMKQKKDNKKQQQKEEESRDNEDLELFSREGPRPNLEKSIETVRQEETQTKADRPNAKEDKLDRSRRSVNQSQEVSVDERIEFSGYTQNDTLQEIRQCDEEEEDYKSKVQSRGRSSRVSKTKGLSRRVAVVEERSEEAREGERSLGSGGNRDKILLF